MARVILDIAINLDDNDQVKRFTDSIYRLNLDLKFKILGDAPNGWPMFCFKGTKINIKILSYMYHNNLI